MSTFTNRYVTDHGQVRQPDCLPNKHNRQKTDEPSRCTLAPPARLTIYLITKRTWPDLLCLVLGLRPRRGGPTAVFLVGQRLVVGVTTKLVAVTAGHGYHLLHAELQFLRCRLYVFLHDSDVFVCRLLCKNAMIISPSPSCRSRCRSLRAAI